MGTRDALVALADSWLGVGESPPHSNCNWICHEFDGICSAWCAKTCSLLLKHTGTPGFSTAAVGIAISQAKAGLNGMQWIPRNGSIRKADFACFDWSGRGNWSEFHISTVRGDFGLSPTFQTDGGNENDAMRQQWRDRTFVQGFIRPAYSDTQPAPAPAPAPAPPPPPPPHLIVDQGDDMTPQVTERPGGFEGHDCYDVLVDAVGKVVGKTADGRDVKVLRSDVTVRRLDTLQEEFQFFAPWENPAPAKIGGAAATGSRLTCVADGVVSIVDNQDTHMLLVAYDRIVG